MVSSMESEHGPNTEMSETLYQPNYVFGNADENEGFRCDVMRCMTLTSILI
jgi:hypothetical protein